MLQLCLQLQRDVKVLLQLQGRIPGKLLHGAVFAIFRFSEVPSNFVLVNFHHESHVFFVKRLALQAGKLFKLALVDGSVGSCTFSAIAITRSPWLDCWCSVAILNASSVT